MEVFDKATALLEEVQQAEIADGEALEQFRIRFLGSKNVLKSIFSEIKFVPNERKREFGQLVNAVKQAAEGKYEELKSALELKEQDAKFAELDLTRPGVSRVVGSRHPVRLVMEEMVDIFRKIGFTVEEDREIEDDWHNFSALNLPEDHPARDMQDTFYISLDPATVLRTHTSSVQVRVMERQKPPIRILSPGKVFRNETISARSHCFFHQVEGLYIDKDVSFADLLQTLQFFASEFFGADTKIKVRPSYFPFTEPSAEVDVSCFLCHGEGCNVCKHTGWVEILGCGMVDPNVLENCKIDSSVYSGFAFGIGVERIVMMKYGIKDIRTLSENDVRFLDHFKSVIV
ncbi:MAG: phenylalanine--tRNA ligase subunit alpha [Chitinophagales bacterium]|nr:phenylalanine--tRNA ligase subunit alpha [Chitinophagales bacterium]